MSVVIASDLAKDIAGAPLLRGISFRLGRRERMTLSGRNGAGKTTLLRMLAGEASLDGGELTLGKGTRVALHDQRPPREAGTLREYVLSGAAELVRIESELAALEAAMADGAHDQATLDRYARAQGRLEHAGGYAWRDRATATVRGLGFGDADLDRALRTFSGGELTRASLARTLVGDPDLLLLDEPTNHLDIASLEWLEQTLSALDAAVVLVAHDRWFLEAVGTCVLELEGGRGRYFAGPWHAWREEKAARELAAGRAAAREAAEREQLERFVARFRYGARARQAQSRVKRLDRLDRRGNGRAKGEARAMALSFSPPPRSGRVVFELEHGRLVAGDRTLLDDVELWVERGEHVALVGPNGAGKTTLIDTLAGRREAAAGKLRRGHNVVLGYLSQHGEELDALPHATVLEVAQKATALSQGATRALLGRFLFGGEDADKPVDALSGGERRRLSLAMLVQSGANVLVLDEPTNHLDLESREALEAALRAFEGSVLLVSHDRALLDAVGTRTVAVEDGTLRSYEGGWADYARVRAERAAEQAPPPRPKKRRARRAPDHAQHAARLEREIETAEAALATLEDELADPSAWADQARADEAAQRHAEAQRAIEDLYAKLEALAP
ncbi:MAG TPA: ABC-F family ATP-binding cassette domain-containing protein [Solirubrobacteraceae bacterium]